MVSVACVQALNAAHAVKDANFSQEERTKLTDRYARSAIEMLKRAAEAGHFRNQKNLERLDKEEDLASLRGREDYRAFRKSL